VCIDVLIDNEYMDLTLNVYGTRGIFEVYPPDPDGCTPLTRTKALFHVLGGFALINHEAACAKQAGRDFDPREVPDSMLHLINEENYSDKAKAIAQEIKEHMLE
jgi:hypothetical protein